MRLELCAKKTPKTNQKNHLKDNKKPIELKVATVLCLVCKTILVKDFRVFHYSLFHRSNDVVLILHIILYPLASGGELSLLSLIISLR